MKAKITGLFFTTFFLGLLVSTEFVFSQTYNDGPVQLQVRLRDVHVTFSGNRDITAVGTPDEYRFKVWVRDMADLDGAGWVNGIVNKSDDDPPYYTIDFNRLLFNYTYPGPLVPQYFDLKMDAWEDNCDADLVSANGTSDNNFDNQSCCVGFYAFGGCVGVSVNDGRRCDADPFITNMDYRQGPPCVWFDHGYVIGNCPANNNYRPRIESFWRYTRGTSCTNALDLGTLNPGGTLTHFNSNICYSNNYPASPGNDVFYSFTISQSMGVRASLCGGATWNTNIYILDGNCNQLFFNNNGATCSPQSEIATNLCNPGNYYVVVDGNSAGEQGVFTLSIIHDPNLTYQVNVTLNQVSCNGANDGSAVATVSGGTAPYTYAWSIPGNTNTQNNLAPGNYTVTVTDDQNCPIAVGFTITQPDVLAITGTFTQPTCNGGSNATLTVATTTGGTAPFSYSIGGAFQPGTTFTGLSAGLQTVTVQDANGCQATTTVQITQPPAILPNLTYTDVTCFGANDGTITPNPTNGTPPYQCMLDGSGVYLPCNTFTNISPGLHTITVQDANGCTASAGVTIITAPSLQVSLVSTTNVSCGGYSDGSLTVSATGGTLPFQYSINNGTTFQASPTFNNIPAGVYTVLVADANNCTNTLNVTITQPNPMIISLLFQINPTCNGDSDGFAVLLASGGTGPYQYSRDGGPFFSSGAFGNLAAGPYSIVAQDANGCFDTTILTIIEPGILSVNVVNSTPASCAGLNNGSLQLGGTGGTPPYSYSLDGGPYQSNATFSNLAPGTFTVGIRDANNCEATGSATVGANVALTLTVNNQTNILCFGDSTGAVSLSTSGGNPPYSYTINNGSGQASGIFSGLPAGVYTFKVTDATGCEAVQQITLTQPPAIVIQLVNTTPASCANVADGSLSISVSGGVGPYSFAWSNQAVTQNLTGVNGGNYIVTVTDQNGCIRSAAFTVQQPNPLFVNFANVTQVQCAGTASGSIDITLNGGTPPFSFNWSNGATTEDVYGLTAGTYTVTITEANGCSIVESATLTEPTAMSATVSATDAGCFGSSDGTATASASGGTPPYSYLWSNFQTTATISGLSAGNYQVVVTDANGCTITSGVVVNQPASSLTATTNITDISCNGAADGSVSVSVIGGTPGYTFNWSNSQTGPTLNNLGPGTYSVTITDAQGCSGIASVIINQPLPLDASVSAIDVACSYSKDGMVITSVTGGTSPYSYVWNTQPPQTTAVASGLYPGSYSMTVTDSKGCTHIINTAISAPDAMSVSLIPGDATCFGSADGEVVVLAAGGLPPYEYSVIPNYFQSDPVFTELPAGTYGVLVRDANSCVVDTFFKLLEPDGILISMPERIITTAGVSVNINPEISTINQIISYTWEPAEGLSCTDCPNPQASPLETTTYTLTILDGEGCQGSRSIEIFVRVKPEVFIPNAFTPNNDGNNDTFGPIDFGAINTMIFRVFDRWGMKVFESNDSQIQWDGTVGGKLAAPGPYVYHLTATLINGEDIEQKGTVTLLR